MMSSYDEHLISMAGGDGDPLDAIAEYVRQRNLMNRDLGSVVHGVFSDPAAEMATLTVGHLESLLALVRTQQATIARVLTLANSSGRCGWRISADELRKTLRGES